MICARRSVKHCYWFTPEYLEREDNAWTLSTVIFGKYTAAGEGPANFARESLRFWHAIMRPVFPADRPWPPPPCRSGCFCSGSPGGWRHRSTSAKAWRNQWQANSTSGRAAPVKRPPWRTSVRNSSSASRSTACQRRSLPRPHQCSGRRRPWLDTCKWQSPLGSALSTGTLGCKPNKRAGPEATCTPCIGICRTSRTTARASSPPARPPLPSCSESWSSAPWVALHLGSCRGHCQ